MSDILLYRRPLVLTIPCQNSYFSLLSDALTPFRNAIISSALHCLQSLQPMHHDELIVLVFMDPEAQPPIKTNGLIGFLT